MKQEEWKDVVGYEEYFQISSEGRVWSKRSNKLIKQETLSGKGYKIFGSRIGGRQGKAVCLRVHVLVAEAFLPEPEIYQIEWAKTTKYGKVLVNHIDSDKSNNEASNLEWTTSAENQQYHHSSKQGHSTRLKMSKSRSVLGEYEVRKIRREYSSGGTSERKLAVKYGVSRHTINSVLNRYKWVK